MQAPKRTDVVNYLQSIKPALLAQGIETVGVFGSVAQDRATPDSDIDIAVRFRPDFLQTHDVWDYFTILTNLKKQVSERFHCSSDVYDLESPSAHTGKIEAEMVGV